VRLAWALGAMVLVTSGARGPGAAQASPVRCEYTSRIECTSAGCAAAAVDGYLRIPPAATLLAATARATSAAALPAIEICTAAGCTPIAVRAARSGIFLNIAQEGGAHFVKIAMADGGGRTGIRKGDFVEVAAQFLSTVTHVGRCPAIVD
jgi:hypothetical protein